MFFDDNSLIKDDFSLLIPWLEIIFFLENSLIRDDSFRK